MAGRWYYRQGQVEAGPVSLADLVALVQAGQLAATHWVREGETNPWQPAGKTPELRLGFETASAPPKPHLSGAMPAMPRPAAASSIRAAAPVKAAPPPLRPTQPAPPVASPPVAAPPMAVAARPAPAVRAVVAAAPVATVAPRSAEEGTSKFPNRRKGSPLGLIIGVGIGGVAMVGIGAAVIFGGLLESDDSTSVAEKPVAKQASEKGAANKKSDDLTELRAKAVTAISKWREAGKATGGLKDLVSFKVEKVTFGAGETGELVVELSVTNAAKTALKYEGWNSTGKHGAWLVDKDNDFIVAASGSAAPQQLEVGKTITEVLKFKTGKENFDELRLVLPYSALARAGQWGYLIPGAMLRGESKAPDAIAAREKPKPSDEAALPKPEVNPGIVANGDDEPAPGINAVKPTPAPETDDGEPKEDIRDLIRKSVGGDKGKAEMKKE